MVLTVQAFVKDSEPYGRFSALAQRSSIRPVRIGWSKRRVHASTISGEKSTPAMRPAPTNGIMRLKRSPPPNSMT